MRFCRRDHRCCRIAVLAYCLRFVVDGKAFLVANYANLSILDRAKAVGHDRETRNSERHRAQDVAIMQRHLEPFIEILVVHVMDAVHRMHIGPREPLHCYVEFCHHLVIVEEVAGHRRCRRRNLFA